MGPNAHLVAYPISGGRQINIVAIVPGTWNRPGWSAPGEANEIKRAFASSRWPATARMLVGAVDDWRRWALFTVPDAGEWSQGQIALLGDAAHAMLPFAAQGAGMAIEDPQCSRNPLSDGATDHPAGVAARANTVRAAAARTDRKSAARRAAPGPHLSHDRTCGRGARFRHSGVGSETDTGVAGTGFLTGGCERERFRAESLPCA